MISKIKISTHYWYDAYHAHSVIEPKTCYLAPLILRLFLNFTCLFSYLIDFEHLRGVEPDICAEMNLKRTNIAQLHQLRKRVKITKIPLG